MVSACMHAKGQLLLIRIEAPSTYLGQFGTERRVELVRRVERAQVVGGKFRQPVLVGDVLGERAVAGVREGRLVHGFERREASLMFHLWGSGGAVVSVCTASSVARRPWCSTCGELRRRGVAPW